MTGRVLVTGGAGFIGSCLVRRLLDAGRDVTVLDALVEAVHGPDAEPPHELAGARFVRGDVCDASAWRTALEGVELIYHFASETGTGESMYRAQRYGDANVGGTALLCDLLGGVDSLPRRVVLASSRAVYGVRPAIPVVELMPVGTARAWACVAASKSPNVAPGSTLTVRDVGSTSTAFMFLNEIIRPPSHTAFPAMLWPAPQTDRSTPCSRAKFTARVTSPSLRQSTMRPGRRSIMAFHIDRASSYSTDSEVSRLPERESRRAAIASSPTVVVSFPRVVSFGIVVIQVEHSC